MPALTLTLDHKRGIWHDRNTEETLREFTFVFLGAQKKRSMWFMVDGVNERREVCASDDGVTGKPKSGFPWTIAPETMDLFDDETESIKCDDCVFSKFDKHYWKAPPCGLQYLCPILFTTTQGAPLQEWRAAYMMIKGSSVKDFHDARTAIKASDNVWFGRTFTTKPILKSIKGRTFAAPQIKNQSKLEYTADDLRFIDRSFEALKESRSAAPAVTAGVKAALGIMKGI